VTTTLGDISVRDLEQELLTFLRQVRRGSVARARSIHPDLQLTGYAVLVWLAAQDGARSADVAAALDLDKGAVSRQIGHLERLRLVERDRDASDHRAQVLTLTTAGRAGVKALQESEQARLRESLASWTPDELQEFTTLMRRYNTSTAGPGPTEPQEDA
jgi:DNA-binding MarR family transcriptional regulator